MHMGCLCCQHQQFARRIACLQTEQLTGLSILVQAIATIRKFSKRKDKIAQAVKKIDIAEEMVFANGLPLGFYSVVSEGVHIFHAREKKRPWLQHYRSIE
jgi:hypothetical protein